MSSWFRTVRSGPIAGPGPNSKEVDLQRSDMKTTSSLSQTPTESFSPTKSVDLPAPATQQTRRKQGFLSRSSPLDVDHDGDHSECSKWTGFTKNLFEWFKTLQDTPTTPILHHHDDYEMRRKTEDEQLGLQGEIDEIVVDRLWSQPTSRQSSENGDASSTHSSICSADRTTFQSQNAWILESPYNPYNFVRWRFWPKLYHFFSPRFADNAMEADYRREDWQQSKRLALVASVFFLVNWILGMSTIAKPVVLADQARLCFLTLDFMLNPEERRYTTMASLRCYLFPSFSCVPITGHETIRFSTSASYVVQHGHGHYTKLFLPICVVTAGTEPFGHVEPRIFCKPSSTSCLAYDSCLTFLINMLLHSYTTALQTIALFGTNLKRLPTTLGALIFLVMRFFRLRIEYKSQMERTQKAQANERKAADSKYRLTSYVFHDEVPLNTALLAVQNMAASGTIAKSQEIEFSALQGSLNMMSKVLNDVLDFNRMDSGKFESVSRPYAFHQVMRSLFMPLKLATDHRGLELVTNLDLNIDEVARRAAYTSMGEDPATIEKYLKELPSGEDNWGMVVGDETRLRQVVTNLANNACKFTPAGGKVTVTTRLVFPDEKTFQSEATAADGQIKSPYDDGLDLKIVESHISDASHDPTPQPDVLDRIIVRIEVSDTGCGIRPYDMIESKLFSAFNQTEQGRRQGGKGTGLGLALVRLIVKLSGGRLGVRSKVGHGSSFWVELPLGVGAKTFISPDDLAIPDQVMTSPKDNTFTELFKVASRGTGASILSSRGATEECDPARIREMQAQSGSVVYEGKYSSYFSVPTRTIGNPFETPNSTSSRVSEKKRSQGIELPSDSTTENAALTPVPTLTCPPLEHRHSPSPLFEQGLQVLVVDDDALTRKLMKRLLERLGCVVTTAENGDKALQILLGKDQEPRLGEQSETTDRPSLETASKFSCIFLDNQMPVTSGLMAVGRLREVRGRSDFVVGVTGNALINDQKEFLEAGADYVLTKPVLERSLKRFRGDLDSVVNTHLRPQPKVLAWDTLVHDHHLLTNDPDLVNSWFLWEAISRK
uniref:histidine kinase n=1 Tax=Moniliophthora roreri TaxID=221103 RepID=A0A0W0EWA4_MONRR